LLHCVDNTTTQKILKQIHGSSYLGIHIGGYSTAKATMFKILRTGYYWPSIFKDSYKFTQARDECQKFAGEENFSAMPLQLILLDFRFSK
jgi:hypothetical protein